MVAFAGHDTTASALGWTLYMLAKYPEHQRKCQDEIDQILAGRENDYVQWYIRSPFIDLARSPSVKSLLTIGVLQFLCSFGLISNTSIIYCYYLYVKV